LETWLVHRNGGVERLTDGDLVVVGGCGDYVGEGEGAPARAYTGEGDPGEHSGSDLLGARRLDSVSANLQGSRGEGSVGVRSRIGQR